MFGADPERWKKNPPIEKIERGGKPYVVFKPFLSHEKRISEFKIRDDDYWVMGYPKTGTTWVQEIVWCIGNNLDFEKSKSIPIDKKFPVLEIQLMVSEDVSDEWLTDSISYAEKMKSPRFIKTHLPWQLIPTEIRTGKVRPKIIYVYREPKDTVISFYNFLNKMGRFEVPFDRLSEAILNDIAPPGPFWTHVNEFKRRQNLPNLLVLSYEDIKVDTEAAIRKIATFLGKSFTDEEFETLKKHASMDSMKQNKSVSIRIVNGQEKEFLGNGLVGTYKEHMTPETIARYDEWSRNNQDFGEEILTYDEE